MNLLELPTPGLLIEQPVLRANLDAMKRRAADHGVTLRPHLKTAKSARIAELASNGPLTVSTLREAEYFAEHGFSDITYAVGITPDKLARAAALIGCGVDLKLLTDNIDAARAIVEHAATHGVNFRVLIELDTGGRRAGVLPDGEELPVIGRVLHAAPCVELHGVLTHAGHSYHCAGVDAVRTIARAERDGLVRAAERLRAAGLPCPVVSAGSTPTAVHGEDWTGVTELRPGVYVFFDLDQLALGSCRRGDLALSVLASVIGHNRHVGHLLLDAGALALSKDLSATEFRAEVGYGEVCDPATLEPWPGLYVRDVHQEHGVVPVPDPALFERLPVGSKVRILPNHACITAAAHDRYHVIEDGRVVDEWDRINGW